MSLAPTLTKLDRKVLKAVPRGISGARAGQMHSWMTHLYGTRAAPNVREFNEILRGLEHVGYVENRNGWWRRTERGQRVLEQA